MTITFSINEKKKPRGRPKGSKNKPKGEKKPAKRPTKSAKQQLKEAELARNPLLAIPTPAPQGVVGGVKSHLAIGTGLPVPSDIPPQLPPTNHQARYTQEMYDLPGGIQNPDENEPSMSWSLGGKKYFFGSGVGDCSSCEDYEPDYIVESVLFDRDKFKGVPKAKKWLKANGFEMKKVDMKENMIRFRQQDPEEIESQGYTEYKTKKLGDSGVELVIVYKSSQGSGIREIHHHHHHHHTYAIPPPPSRLPVDIKGWGIPQPHSRGTITNPDLMEPNKTGYARIQGYGIDPPSRGSITNPEVVSEENTGYMKGCGGVWGVNGGDGNNYLHEDPIHGGKAINWGKLDPKKNGVAKAFAPVTKFKDDTSKYLTTTPGFKEISKALTPMNTDQLVTKGIKDYGPDRSPIPGSDEIEKLTGIPMPKGYGPMDPTQGHFRGSTTDFLDTKKSMKDRYSSLGKNAMVGAMTLDPVKTYENYLKGPDLTGGPLGIYADSIKGPNPIYGNVPPPPPQQEEEEYSYEDWLRDNHPESIEGSGNPYAKGNKNIAKAFGGRFVSKEAEEKYPVRGGDLGRFVSKEAQDHYGIGKGLKTPKPHQIKGSPEAKLYMKELRAKRASK